MNERLEGGYQLPIAGMKRRQAIEPAIGHAKADHRMNRCWLKGTTGDALHALLCAAGYNSRWLLRAIVRLGIKPVFCACRSAGCKVPEVPHGFVFWSTANRRPCRYRSRWHSDEFCRAD